MKAFDRLFEILDFLLSPEGCPWDREQTLQSLRSTVLEEVHELIEAVDLEDGDKICEELGDLIFNAVFFCRLAEKQGMFKREDALNTIADKLIRRHPHVFGEVEANTAEEAHASWDAAKAKEANGRKSALDGIPKGLPALAKAAKMRKRIRKSEQAALLDDLPTGDAEWEFGKKLLSMVDQADGVDPEAALARVLSDVEAKFRAAE